MKHISLDLQEKINARCATPARAFAEELLDFASEKKLSIREFEEACQLALDFCRMATVPSRLGLREQRKDRES